MNLFFVTRNAGKECGLGLCCQVIPNPLIRTGPLQVLEVSKDMVVNLPLERLQVILRQEHRAGKRIPFPGYLRYERVLRSISACTTKVHSIRVPSGTIPLRTADFSQPWHQLSNAAGTVTVKVSVKQR